MPLKKGKSKKAFQSNVRELYHSLRGKGRGVEKARQMALAAAFNIRRGGRKRKKKKRKRGKK